MSIVYKVDVVAALKEAGYSTYRIRKEKIIGEATLQKLRQGDPVSWDCLDILCKLLRCQPGDLLRYVSDFAPPGEWCDGCHGLGGRTRGGGDCKERPWCFAYTIELLAGEDGAIRKCEKCLQDSVK